MNFCVIFGLLYSDMHDTLQMRELLHKRRKQSLRSCMMVQWEDKRVQNDVEDVICVFLQVLFGSCTDAVIHLMCTQCFTTGKKKMRALINSEYLEKLMLVN